MNRFYKLCCEYFGRTGFEVFYTNVRIYGLTRDNIVKFGFSQGYPVHILDIIADKLDL